MKIRNLKNFQIMPETSNLAVALGLEQLYSQEKDTLAPGVDASSSQRHVAWAEKNA